jgi:16S rRNA (guanine966-N2)-methyltransferase
MGWVAPHSWISVETARGEVLDVPGFAVEATRGVGKAELHLLRPTA